MKEASFDSAKATGRIENAGKLQKKNSILSGSDTFIFEASAVGCDGELIGFASTAATELVEMHESAVEEDFEQPKAIWHWLGPLAWFCWRSPFPDYRTCMKGLLVLQGSVPNATVRPPQLAISDSERIALAPLAKEASILEAVENPAKLSAD